MCENGAKIYTVYVGVTRNLPTGATEGAAETEGAADTLGAAVGAVIVDVRKRLDKLISLQKRQIQKLDEIHRQNVPFVLFFMDIFIIMLFLPFIFILPIIRKFRLCCKSFREAMHGVSSSVITSKKLEQSGNETPMNTYNVSQLALDKKEGEEKDQQLHGACYGRVVIERLIQGRTRKSETELWLKK